MEFRFSEQIEQKSPPDGGLDVFLFAEAAIFRQLQRIFQEVKLAEDGWRVRRNTEKAQLHRRTHHAHR